mmetsp:Transcript_108517/g.305862  ORF Transcript_108517/g.305862 Transcript_108517/m.305862 type:complete len:489 (-) Transcript_108517:132-1598(-)
MTPAVSLVPQGNVRASFRSASVIAALVLMAPALADSKQETKAHPVKTEFFKLPTHSFEKVLSDENGLGNWLRSAGTMAMRDRVQVMPPVPDRYGLFWNKRPVRTQDFELEFSFIASTKPPTDGTFAVWISPTDFAAAYDEKEIVTTSKNWTEGLQHVGLTCLSNKAAFTGLGIFFFAQSPDGKPREFAVGVWNDGKTQLTLDAVRAEKLPGAKTVVTGWSGKEMSVTIRVRPNGEIHVSMAPKDKPEYADMFSLNVGALSSDMFFGFSGWSGSSAHIELDIHSVETRNFDITKVGEEAKDVAGAESWRVLLEQEKRFIDQASQMQAIKKLTSLLNDHITSYANLGRKMEVDVAEMGKRLDNLGADFGKLVAETEAFDFTKNTFDKDVVRQHIKGIHSIFKSARDTDEAKMLKVHQVAQELKAKGGSGLGEESKKKVESASNQAKLLEEHATRGSTQTGMLLLMLVFSVASLGMLFLNRMRYYEKKHYI